MEESDNADISGISDTTSGQIEEEGEDDVTPVTKSKKAQSEEQPDEQIFNAELPEPETDPNADPNAAEVDNPVSISFIAKESGKEDELSIETVASIEPVKGCDGSTTTNGNVEFLVTPKAGWTTTLTAAAVYTNAEEGTANPSISGPTSDKVTITRPSKGFAGDILVTVTGTRVVNSLKTDSGLTGAYLYGEFGGDLGTNPALSTTAISVPFEGVFSEGAQPISIAVPKASATKNAKVLVQFADDSSNKKDLTREEGTVKIGDDDFVLFTFNPYEVYREKAEAVENTNTTYELFLDTAAEAWGLNFDVSDATYYDIGKVVASKLETSREYEYKEFTDDDNAPALRKDNYQTTGEGDEAKKNLLIFTVEPKTGKRVKISKVYAELRKNSDAGTVDALQTILAEELTYKESPSATETKTCYGIDLSKIDDSLFKEAMKLWIKADTEFIAESEYAKGFENHTIEFTGALDTVNIHAKNDAAFSDGDLATTNALAKYPAQNDDTKIYFAIDPKDGYLISKGTDYNDGGNKDSEVVTVTYDKVYQFTYDTDKTGYIKETEKKELPLTKVTGTSPAPDFWKAELTLYSDTDDNGDLVAAFDDDRKQAAVDQNDGVTSALLTSVDDLYAWSLKNIKIAVKTELATEKTGVVTVTGITPDMSYDVTGTAISRDGDSDRWNIDEDADLLVLTVNSEMKPTVEYETAHADASPATWGTAEVNGENGTYTAKIPVSLLELDDDTDKIDAKIRVSKGNKTLHAYNEVPAPGPNVDFTGKIKIAGPENAFNASYKNAVDYNATPGNTDDAVSITDGSNVTVTLYAEAGSLFDKAYYVLKNDEEKTKHDLELNAEKTEATFTVKMTDDVDVFTTTTKTYRYKITYTQSGVTPNPEAVAAGDGVYVIPKGVTSVKIEAFNGPAAGDTQNIHNVRIFDGGQAAAAKFTISPANTVNLTLSKDDGELINLEIKGKGNGNRILDLPSISIRQDKMAEEIVIKDDDGNQIDSVNLLPGEQKGPYTVEVVNGSLDFMNKNIAMEIARDASKPGQQTSDTVSAGAMTVSYDGIKASFNTAEKKLTIEGLDGKKGNDNPVTLRFYDVQKRKENKEENPLGIIAGSEISVKLDSPAIALVTPTVAANNTVNNLLLTLATPDFEESDGIWYRVAITGSVTEPKEVTVGTDAEGNPIKEKNIVDNIQGLQTPYVGQNHSGNYGKEIWVKKLGASQEILIPVNYAEDKDGNLLDKVQEYSLTVELVQKMKADPLDETLIWKVGNTGLIISPAAKLTTKTAEAIYPTDLTLDKTTATVYTGQADQKIATATFGDAKGVRQLKTTIVDAKTGAAVGNRWTQYGVDGSLSASADLDGNIYVHTTNMSASKTLPKNIGVKVSAFAKDASEISKIITLKFVNGVDFWGGIRFENGNDRVLYRQDGKKATLKLKAVINEDSGVKAKNQKQITYALGDANKNAYGEKGYKLSANLQNNVTVNAKNGTVTVSKDYLYDDKNNGNKFSVIATLTGTDKKAYVMVTISQLAQEKGDIVIVDEDGKVIARDGGTISAETFASKTLYVRALKTTVAQTNNSYGYDAFGYDKYFVEGIGFTSGNKKALTISKTTGELKMVGAANNKAVKITAVNNDGSKKVKSTISVTLTGPKALGIWLNGPEGKWNGATKTYQYNGAMKERFVVQPLMYVNGKETVVPQEYYKNLKITVKSAKKTEKKDVYGNRWFEIIKSAPVTTITISDKTDKTVAPVTYTIEQSPATPVKGKALKVKTVTKLTETMLNSAKTAAEHDDGKVKITFQITGKDAAAYAGKYIMLTPDYSKKKLVNKIENTEEFRRANSYFLGGDGEEIVKIEADGTFTLELDMWRKAAQQRIPGTYKLMAAVGQYGSKGTFEFIDGVKSATVSVKIPGKAPKKLGIETKGDYTLSTGGGEVSLATGIDSAYSWSVEGSYPNYAKNVVNSDGTVNNFKKYFYVRRDPVTGEYKLGMNNNGDLKVAEIEALLKDTEGKDRKGFVTVTSYNEMGKVETKDVLINVNLVQTGTLTAKANDTYRGAKAVVKLSDLEGNALDVYSAGLDKSAAAQTDIKSAKPAKDGKSIEVEISEKAGDSVSVDLKVLAAGSAFATANGKATTDTYLQKYGDSVKVSINLADPSTATDTAEVVTKEDDMAFKAERVKGLYDTDYAKLDTDDSKQGYNSYFDNGSAKKYVLRVDVKSKIEGAEVNSAALNKTTADKTVQSILTVAKGKKNNEILITLDQKKFLQECAKEGATVEKGGTITVPVEVGFTISTIKKQTIDLSVKLPNPITYAEAVAAMKAAQSEIEGMTPGEYLGTETSKANLQKRINEAFRKAVPLDAEAIVTPEEITLGTAVDGKYKATVLIKQKSTKQDTDYEHEFVWNETSETKWDAEELMKSIKDLLSPNGGADNGKWLEGKINALESNKTADKIVDNNYTADDFVNDLTALLKSEKNVELGKNMIIETTKFSRTRATKSGDGKFTIEIRTRNGEDKKTDWTLAKYNTSTTLNITKIANLGDEGKAVKDAVDALDYNQLVYEALGQGDIVNLEQYLENAIRSAAEEALKSKDVEIKFEQRVPDTGDDNKSGDTKKNLAVKLPFEDAGSGNAWTDGYVKFKILVHQESAITDYVIDCTSTNKKALDKDWKSSKGETFQRLDQIEKALTDNSKLTGNAAVDKILEADAPTKPGCAKKVTFSDKIELKDGWDTAAENRVKYLIGKLVNGMYLTVEVDVDERTSATPVSNPVTGTVTITDSTGRSKVDGNTYYKIEFAMPVTTALSEGTKMSELGDPKRVDRTVWDGEIKEWAPNGQPDWDRVSGLVVGKPEKVDSDTYKVTLSGTLKYVQGWTDFSSVAGYENGYYAAVSVPIPDDLKKIVNDNANANNVYIQSAGDIYVQLKGSQIKAEGADWTFVQRMNHEDDHSQIKKGDKSGVRGFKIVVDYDPMSNGDSSTSVDVEAGGTHKRITYIFDASAVKLDHSSVADVKLLPDVVSYLSSAGESDVSIGTFLTALGLTADTVKALKAEGHNDGGKKNVIKGTGEIKETHLTTFPDDHKYYVAVSIKAPDYVRSAKEEEAVAEATAKVGTFTSGSFVPTDDLGGLRFGNVLADKKFDEAVMVLAVNDASLSQGKNHMAIEVDWGTAWEPTIYRFDLSDVLYTPAAP